MFETKEHKKQTGDTSATAKSHHSDSSIAPHPCSGCNLCHQMTRIHSTVGPSIFHAVGGGIPHPNLQRPCATNFFQRNLGNSYLQSMASNRQVGGYATPRNGLPIIQRKCACEGSCATGIGKEDLSKIQTKLTVSSPNDIYEQEADRVAEQLMRMPESACPGCNTEERDEEELIQTKPIAARITPLFQVDEEEISLQGRGFADQAYEVALEIEDRINALKGGGQPLPESLCTYFEPRFGYDLSKVRVHADERAAESARAVNADAFTVGRNIVFNAGRYAPETLAGKKLLAHELVHIIQQSDGKLERPCHIARQAHGAGVTEAVRSGSDLDIAAEDASQVNLAIVRQGGVENTFISNETISFTVHIGAPAAGTLAAQVSGAPAAGTLAGRITWTVYGISANSGNGNPHSAVNQSAFSFTPNPTNRPTTGSRSPNDPIQYRVEARVANSIASYYLKQDESDIIRQEYIDLGPVTPPPRSDIMVPAVATFNTGNYTRIVDVGMNNALNSTQAQFRRLTQQAAATTGGRRQSGSVPASRTVVPQPAISTQIGSAPTLPAAVSGPAINVISGYRNPRRNVWAGSQYPVTSKHVWGRALDLGVAGANAVLWERLRQAGANAGYISICEYSAVQLPCNDPTINHVHIQW